MGTSPTGIYNLDYTNTVWNQLLPPDKRKPKWLAWGAAIMNGKQWKNDALLGSYMLGSSDPAYNNATTYVTGNRIIYYIQGGGSYCGDNGVYEAISINADGTNNAGFSGIPPTGVNIVPAIAPSWVVDSTTALKWLTGYYWVKVQDSFIGAIEMTNWSCQQLTMEIALNRWFNVANYANYQWDHTVSPPFTQIYIDTDVVITRQEPAYSLPNGIGEYSRYIFSTYGCFSLPPPASQYNFTIMVPVAIFNQLVYPSSAFSAGHTEGYTIASGLSRNGSIIRALVDKFNAVGMLYNITTY